MAMVPRDRVGGEEARRVLAAAAGDVVAAGVGEVAVGRAEADRALDAVDVDGVPLAKGLLAALHGEAQATGRHGCLGIRIEDRILS